MDSVWLPLLFPPSFFPPVSSCSYAEYNHKGELLERKSATELFQVERAPDSSLHAEPSVIILA